jgi:hypothetical protein
MKGIALARALRDPVLGPSIAAILRREASLFDAQIMYQAIVAPAKLDPALMSRPMTPQRFEALVQQADVLLQAEYAALAGKLQLEREVLQNADTMFSSKALLRLVTMDMAERGYSWSDESLQFTPSKKVRRQANP